VYWPSYTNELSAIRRLNADAVADVSAIGPGIDDDPPADVVTGEYRNRLFASVVPRAVFVGAKPVAQALVKLPERRLANAPLRRCRFTVEQAYEGRGLEAYRCVNKRFYDWPDETPDAIRAFDLRDRCGQ